MNNLLNIWIFNDLAPKLTPILNSKSQSIGSTFNIFCGVDQGSLPLSFEWSKNGQIIKSGYNLNYKIENSKKFSNLIIDEIVRSDSGNYSCAVRNSVGSDSQSVVLSVIG